MSVSALKSLMPKIIMPKGLSEIDRLVINAQQSIAEGKDNIAIDAYENAIALGCTTVGVHCALGNLYLKVDENLRAERLAIQALVRKPNHIPAMRLLGDSLKKKFPADVVKNCYHGSFPPYIGEKYFHNSLDSIKMVDSPFVQRHLAYPAESAFLYPPKKIHHDTHKEFFLQRAVSPDRYVDVISEGSVWYDDFNIALFDGNQNRLNDHPVALGYGPMTQHLAAKTEPFKIEGTAMLIGARGSCGFGHWMLDTLPALDAVQKSGIPLDSIDKFIISGGELGFKRTTLESFGITADRIYDVAQCSHVSADKLIVADVVTNMARRMGSWVPEFLRNEFLLKQLETNESEPIDIGESESGRRLYISRGGVGTRGVENEEEIVSFIEQYGFERITIETMTLQEQARLFNQCEVVIAPHGAALINLVHCRPGTKLIEFFSEHIEPCFWIMSRLSKLDYFHHYCGANDENTRAEPSVKAVKNGVNGSYTVNLDELSNLFEYAGVIKS